MPRLAGRVVVMSRACVSPCCGQFLAERSHGGSSGGARKHGFEVSAIALGVDVMGLILSTEPLVVETRLTDSLVTSCAKNRISRKP